MLNYLFRGQNLLCELIDLDYPTGWKIIEIGYFPFVTKKLPGNNTVVKISCAWGTYGYISNVKKLRKYIFWNWNRCTIILPA